MKHFAFFISEVRFANNTCAQYYCGCRKANRVGFIFYEKIIL